MHNWATKQQQKHKHSSLHYIKHTNMQLVETHIHAETEDTLPSSEEDIEAQMQTPTKRRKYRQRQRTQKRTEQMCMIQSKETTRANDTTQSCTKVTCCKTKYGSF